MTNQKIKTVAQLSLNFFTVKCKMVTSWNKVAWICSDGENFLLR